MSDTVAVRKKKKRNAPAERVRRQDAAFRAGVRQGRTERDQELAGAEAEPAAEIDDLPAIMREVETALPGILYWIGRGREEGKPLTYAAIIIAHDGTTDLGVGENPDSPASALREALAMALAGTCACGAPLKGETIQ